MWITRLVRNDTYAVDYEARDRQPRGTIGHT